nr:hypothetical protein [Tanacetum cinerariifolium]
MCRHLHSTLDTIISRQAAATWQYPIGQPPVTWHPRQHRSASVNAGQRCRTTGQRRQTTGQWRRSTAVIGGQWWQSTTIDDGGPPLTTAEPPLTTTGPPLTTTGPPVNGG